MTRQENPVESYHEEQDQRNTLLLREVMDSLPQFCRQFFRGISENGCLTLLFNLVSQKSFI